MSEAEVSLVKERADIQVIIGERVNLKKAGRSFKGLCPFHGEKSPSFFVTPEMQMFKCFGCGVGGDVISFLQNYEGWDFREALEYLAKRVGVTLTPYRVTGQEDKRERWLESLHLAYEYYQYLLFEHPIGEKARAYLKNRGLYIQTLKDFGVGYSLESWDGLQRFLIKKKGYKAEELEATGMVIRRTGGFYDRFRGRIMFPLKDFGGHIVGFSGRVLDADVKEAHSSGSAGSGQAKYINSPETVLYHKSECLFGLSQAKRAIREADRVVVVEGEMDVMMSHQAGLKEVVAIKGSALTEQQVLHLRKLTKTMVLSMDADEAGQEAIRRGIEVAEKQGINLRVIRILGGKDPADVVRTNPQEWLKIADQSMPVYQFFMEWAFEHFDSQSGTGQKQISEYLAPIYSRIENAVERSFYLKKLAERLGVAEQIIETEVARAGKQGVGEPVKKAKESEFKTKTRREKLERYVVSLALHFNEPAQYWHELEPSWFSEYYLQRLVTELTRLAEGEPRLKGARVLDLLPGELKPLVQELFGADEDLWRMSEEEIAKTWKSALRDLKQLSIKTKLKEVMQKLSAMADDTADREQLQSEYRSLTQSLKSLD